MKKWVLAVVLAILLRSVVTGAVTTLSVAVKFIETYKMKRLKQRNLFECIKYKIANCNMRKSSRIWSGLVLGVIFLTFIPIVVNASAIFNPYAEVKIVGFPSETIANGDNFFTIVLTNKDVLTGIDSADEKGAKVILKLDAGIFKSVELLSADGCDNCFDKYEGKGTSELTIGKSFLAEGSSAVAIVRYSTTKERGDITLTATGEIKGPDGYIDSGTTTISSTIVTLDYPLFSIKTLIETADRRGKFYNQSAELLQTVLFNEKTLNDDMQNAWTNSMFWIMGLGAQMFMMPLQEPSTSAKALLKDGTGSYLDHYGRITGYYLESTFASMDSIIGKMGVDMDYRGRIYLLTKALKEMAAATDYEIKCWERDPLERSYLKLMFQYGKSSTHACSVK
jgi:hypothetical protein